MCSLVTLDTLRLIHKHRHWHRTWRSHNSDATMHHTFQIVLERVPVDLKRLAFSFSVAYLKMAGATRPKRRALQKWLLVWWDKYISNEYPARTYSECKTTFARLTQSQAISQSFCVFISFTSRRDTTFFHFSKLFFYTKLPFPLPWWSKYLLVENLRWRAVNFEIHLCSSDMKSDCIWRLISIQCVQIEPGVNSDLGNGSFWVEICDAKHVDLHVDRRRWRSILVWSHQLTSDLKRRLLFCFWICLRWSSLKAVSVPTSVMGGLRGSIVTSALVSE